MINRICWTRNSIKGNSNYPLHFLVIYVGQEMINRIKLYYRNELYIERIQMCQEVHILLHPPAMVDLVQFLTNLSC